MIRQQGCLRAHLDYWGPAVPCVMLECKSSHTVSPHTCAAQVLDAEARKQLPHTLRWYQTVASQPRFSDVAGPVKLADKVPCRSEGMRSVSNVLEAARGPDVVILILAKTSTIVPHMLRILCPPRQRSRQGCKQTRSAPQRARQPLRRRRQSASRLQQQVWSACASHPMYMVTSCAESSASGPQCSASWARHLDSVHLLEVRRRQRVQRVARVAARRTAASSRRPRARVSEGYRHNCHPHTAPSALPRPSSNIPHRPRLSVS
jgi:hypothetical protein